MSFTRLLGSFINFHKPFYLQMILRKSAIFALLNIDNYLETEGGDLYTLIQIRFCTKMLDIFTVFKKTSIVLTEYVEYYWISKFLAPAAGNNPCVGHSRPPGNV